jgi:hypothetical protein
VSVNYLFFPLYPLNSLFKRLKVQFWTSQNEKRHAFVTFETTDAAKQALHLVNDPDCRLSIKPVNKNTLFRYQPPGFEPPQPPPSAPSAPLQDRLKYGGGDETQKKYPPSRKTQTSPLALKHPTFPGSHERPTANNAPATSTRPYDHSAPKDINLRATLSLRTKELQDSKSDFEKLKGLEQSLARTLDTVRKEKAELQQNYQKLHEHVKVMSGELQYFRKKADEAASNPNREREFEEAKKKYMGEIEVLSGQAKSLREESDLKSQVISSRDSELVELKRKYEALQADHSRLSEQHYKLQQRQTTRSPSSKPSKLELEDGEVMGDVRLISRHASSVMSDAEAIDGAKIVTLVELEKAYHTLDEIVTMALVKKVTECGREKMRKKRRIEEG